MTSDRVTPAPVRLDRAPYLDAIARTDRGFMPLVGVETLLLEILSATPAPADPAPRAPRGEPTLDRGATDA